jgi:hypothetical protein
MRAGGALLGLGLCLLTASPSCADALRLTSVGIRGGVTGWTVIGADEIEQFQRYDVLATVALPWIWYSETAWGLDTALMASAGALLGGGEAGFIGTLTPVLALRSRDQRFSVDAGIGGALLTRHKFGDQQWGGPFQLVLTGGFRIPIYRALGIGYRYQHLSDADLYGNPSRGADFHMLELTYRFP